MDFDEFQHIADFLEAKRVELIDGPVVESGVMARFTCFHIPRPTSSNRATLCRSGRRRRSRTDRSRRYSAAYTARSRAHPLSRLPLDRFGRLHLA